MAALIFLSGLASGFLAPITEHQQDLSKVSALKESKTTEPNCAGTDVKWIGPNQFHPANKTGYKSFKFPDIGNFEKIKLLRVGQRCQCGTTVCESNKGHNLCDEKKSECRKIPKCGENPAQDGGCQCVRRSRVYICPPNLVCDPSIPIYNNPLGFESVPETHPCKIQDYCPYDRKTIDLLTWSVEEIQIHIPDQEYQTCRCWDGRRTGGPNRYKHVGTCSPLHKCKKETQDCECENEPCVFA